MFQFRKVLKYYFYLFLLCITIQGCRISSRNIVILIPKSAEPVVKSIYNFAKNKGYLVTIRLLSGSSSILTHISLEKIKSKSDIVLFLNDYESAQLNLEKNIIRKEKIDIGYLTILSQEGILIDALEDLIPLANRIAWLNPLTSSSGKDFVLWTHAVYSKNRWKNFWVQISQKVKFFAKSWEEAYHWYDKGLVNVMIGYHTDNAYNIYNQVGKLSQINYLKEGWIQRCEYALLLRNSKEGQDFMDFFTSQDFQEIIPLTNWMLPVAIQREKLPEVFQKFVPIIHKEDKVVNPTQVYSPEEIRDILLEWEQIWVGVN